MGEESEAFGAVMNFYTTIKNPSDDSLFSLSLFLNAFCVAHQE